MLNLLKTGLKRTWTVTTACLGLYGAYSLAPIIRDAYLIKKLDNEDDNNKKSVLVIPFHRITFTDEPKPELPFDFSSSSNDKKNRDTRKKVVIEIKDFVSLLHKAAEDPNIVGLYGTCGEDNSINVNGLAQLEEVRNAVRVFSESHRRHPEPNLKDEQKNEDDAPKEKPCHFFSYSFDSVGSVNMQYYLASAFSQISLQHSGDLNIFGMSSGSVFLKSALETYGMKFHVFKHGLYKNAPNMFTENTFTPEHHDNVNNLITSVQINILNNISKGRKDSKNFNPELWEAIMRHGTMTALNAQEVGYIDSILPVDPMDKWSKEVADNFITLSEYKDEVDAKVKGKRLKTYFKAVLDAAQKCTLSDLGSFKEEYKKQQKLYKEKIVILNVLGGINKTSASKLITSIKKIKEDDDVKSVILRIDSPGGGAMESEVILSECSDLSQPVICSMSNVAASGGYYIASNCKKIFAQPVTITGSIGVYGIKVDLTDIALRNGINVENVSIMPHTTDHASALSLFKPLSEEASVVIKRNIDNVYDRFKSVVSKGRNIPMDDVNNLAQGKIYSGEQAKEIGLVDTFGGINAAIDYAQRNYTDSGNAIVEVWPKLSSLDVIREKLEEGNISVSTTQAMKKQNSLVMNNLGWLVPSLNVQNSKSGFSGALLTMDETSAVQYMLEE